MSAAIRERNAARLNNDGTASGWLNHRATYSPRTTVAVTAGRHFRMELHAPVVAVSAGGDRRGVGSGQDRKGRAGFNVVAVALQHGRALGNAVK